MHDFNKQNSCSDTEIEIVDLQVPDRGIALFFFSLGKIPSLATKYIHNRIMHIYPLILLALLIAILIPDSSSMNAQSAPAHHPQFNHSSSLQFGACDASVNTTPGHGFSGQTSTSPPIYPTWGASAACTDQIQVTVLPMPQNNRNHDP
jgi:hypothetical protein